MVWRAKSHFSVLKSQTEIIRQDNLVGFFLQTIFPSPSATVPGQVHCLVISTQTLVWVAERANRRVVFVWPSHTGQLFDLGITFKSPSLGRVRFFAPETRDHQRESEASPHVQR